jgi:hypothetical protein
LNDAVAIFEMEFNFISKLTGIDRISLGTQTPTADTAARSIQYATASTDNVLKPMYGGYLWLKEALARNMTSRIQTICVFNTDKDRGYNDAIGDAAVEAIKQAGKDRCMKWGITITAKPTEEEKAIIRQTAQQAMTVGRNGTPLLDYSDFLFVDRMLRNGSMKFAEAYLNLKIQKKEKQVQDNMQANMQVQGQQNQELEAKKMQNAMQMTKFQTDEAIRLEDAKEQFKVRTGQELAAVQDSVAQNDHGRKLTEIQHTEQSKAVFNPKPQPQGAQTEMEFEEPQPPM